MVASSPSSQLAHSGPALSLLSPIAPLIGRQKELCLIMNYAMMAQEGQMRVLLVTGEPGIGKTRLLQEIAAQATQENAIILQGSASEAEGMPPYLLFVEALSDYLHRISPDQLRTQITPTSSLLTSILPELAVMLNDLSMPYPLPLEQVRLRLYEAIGHFLQDIATSHLLLLLLDDLQWADAASLDVLCYIARHTSPARLLILGACRESDIIWNPGLEHTLAELNRQRVLTHLVLRPLSAHDIARLTEAALGGPLSPDLCALLSIQSGGNPFFIEELLRGWAEMGMLVQTNKQWTAIKPLEHVLPANIVGTLRQRLIRLAPHIIDHLRVAAIIGRTFDLSLLATVEEQEEETVEECLLEAERAQLVRSTLPGVFTFSHDTIRECISSEVSSSRRRRLHEAIGTVLEGRYHQETASERSHLAELAFHFTHSNDHVRGACYAQQLAEQALQRGAAEDAVKHYHAALDLYLDHDRRRGELLLGLGEAELLAAHEEQAAMAYETAQEVLIQVGDFPVAGRAAHGVGLARWKQEQLIAAYDALEQALRLFNDALCAEVVHILVDASTLLIISLEQPTEGYRYAQRVIEVAQQLGDERIETVADRTMAEHLFIHGSDLATVVQRQEDALQCAHVHNDHVEAEHCYFSLTILYYWLADIGHSHEMVLRHIALLESCDMTQPPLLLMASSWSALQLASQGKWAQAEQVVASAYHSADRHIGSKPLAFLHHIQGFLAYQQEEYGATERECQAALVHLQGGPDRLMCSCGLLGLARACGGKRAEARASMAVLEKQLATLQVDTLPTAPIIMCMALIAMLLNEQERFAGLYIRLLTFQGQHYWFLVDRVLGELATCCGAWERAMMHLVAAQTTAQREGLRPELARISVAQANLELARTSPERIQRAMEALQHAIALFEELEMEASRRYCQDQLHTLSTQAVYLSSPKRPTLPGNLTQREVEVLKLVASGKSNSQIASALGICEKTVTHHLTHILNKTTSENRAAATAFAIRHGLA